MEFDEGFLQHPAPGLDVQDTVTLTASEKLELVQWASSTTYRVFLKLAEGVIEISETRHLQSWQDSDKFQRTGLVAVAQRMFFEALQKTVAVQYAEFKGEMAFAKQQKENLQEDPETFIRRQNEQ
jgi:hypothetical protein